MLTKLLACLGLSLLLMSAQLGTVSAATTEPNRGLLITPIRQFLSADAGKTTAGSVVIANLTDSALPVNLGVQSFAVSDYAYTYSFATPKPNWLHLEQPSLSLAAGQSQTVRFSFEVPAGATPGGHYYTIVASAKLKTKGIDNTIQAASMLYVTINGPVQKSSRLSGSSIARFSFGTDIPYSLDIKNTGNIHYFAYVTGKLDGFLATPAPVESAHLLLPETIRRIDNAIPSPVLPGVYKATFGYRTDAGETQTVSDWVVYLPPWSVAFAIAALLLTGGIVRRRRRRRTVRPATTEPPTG